MEGYGTKSWRVFNAMFRSLNLSLFLGFGKPWKTFKQGPGLILNRIHW